jgi:tetratricopeptide (TPR) repeat protein
MRVKKLFLGICAGVFSVSILQSSYGMENIQNKTAGQIIEGAKGETLQKLKEESVNKIVSEATTAISNTRTVIELLQKGKIEEALNLLQKIETTLEQLEKQYKVSRIPVDITLVEYDGVEDINIAKKYAEKIKTDIQNNNFVDARFYLSLLRDEIDVTTTYMPLYMYTNAIKLALDYLKNGKVQSALLVLQSALGILEVEITIVPKPLIEASILIDYASQLYKTKPEVALKLLEQAKYDVELAKVLGYLPNNVDISPLVEKITSLEKAIKSQSATVNEQFQSLKAQMKTFRQQNTQTHKIAPSQ